VVALHALTLLVGAFLLFWVQLFVAKMILPLLGGAPAVWNTCMVFFQFLLLIGYGIAHLVTTRLSPRRQVVIQLLLLSIPALLLPVVVPSGWTGPGEQAPIPWLLALLSLTVAAPFLALSTTAPLIQSWFSRIGHSESADPYFLYAASNTGSLASLLAYPLLLEPSLKLSTQSQAWSIGYLLLLALQAACGFALWRRAGSFEASSTHEPLTEVQATAREGREGKEPSPARPENDAALPEDQQTSPHRIAQWILLSLIPSSLLYGVTTLITTDLAPVPLLWILPLAVYLASFIVAFSRWPIAPFLLPAVLLPGGLAIAAAMSENPNLADLVRPAGHVALLFVIGTVLHRRLADARPSADSLTGFYFVTSLGGLLGGVLNGILAPLVFRSVGEYPIALALALMVLGQSGLERQTPARRRLLVGGMLVGILGSIVALRTSVLMQGWEPIALGLFLALLIRKALQLSWDATGLALATIVLIPAVIEAPPGKLISIRRSFFGVHRIVRLEEPPCRVLIHGTTVHGCQSLDPKRRREPLSYYSRPGPIGDVFRALEARGGLKRVSLVGLGAGAITAYAKPGQDWTIYEIDPVVVSLAQDPKNFTYLQDMAVRPRIVVSDGRLGVAADEGPKPDLLIIDAFSSGSIPVHMLTREAFDSYLMRLAPDGVIALHISNAHINLQPIVTAVARDLKLACRGRVHGSEKAIDSQGYSPSRWVVMARREEDFGRLSRRWPVLDAKPGVAAWTDDRASIVPYMGLSR